MNTYTRDMTQENRGTAMGALAGKRSGFVGFAARVSLFMLLIFFAISAQMHLRAEIERLNKQAMEIQQSIHMLNVQCTNLRNKRERLTDRQNIQAKIQRYRLGLRDADYRQISYITLEAPRGVRKTLRPVQARDSVKKTAEYAFSRP